MRLNAARRREDVKPRLAACSNRPPCVAPTGEREESPAAGPGGRGRGQGDHVGQPQQGRREVWQAGGAGGPGGGPAGEGTLAAVSANS